MNRETSLSNMIPHIEVKAGEISYIGHFHYEIGKNHFGKTMKRIFTSGAKENLENMGGLLVEAEQQVTDKKDDMKVYLQSIGLGNYSTKAQIVEGWKYVPD